MRYMLSVAGNYNFLEFISNAKSGEFFFFSHDERFMIKTMKAKGHPWTWMMMMMMMMLLFDAWGGGMDVLRAWWRCCCGSCND